MSLCYQLLQLNDILEWMCYYGHVQHGHTHTLRRIHKRSDLHVNRDFQQMRVCLFRIHVMFVCWAFRSLCVCMFSVCLSVCGLYMCVHVCVCMQHLYLCMHFCPCYHVLICMWCLFLCVWVWYIHVYLSVLVFAFSCIECMLFVCIYLCVVNPWVEWHAFILAG